MPGEPRHKEMIVSVPDRRESGKMMDDNLGKWLEGALFAPRLVGVCCTLLELGVHLSYTI